jgi:iron complex outermembrane receptor protein
VLTGALNDVGAPLRANVKSSFRRGIEWELEKNWTEKKGRISLNTTLSQNKIRTYDEIIYAYTDSTMSELHKTHNNTDIGFSPRVISALVLEKGLGKNWSIMVGEKYVSKQFLDNTQNNDRAIAAYAITDIKVSHTFRRDGLEIQTGIWVNNAWNAMYSSNGYTYSYYYGSLVTERFYYPQAGRNFMVTCAIKFTAD